MRKIFITSYPYVYERYFRVFDYFPEKDRLVFILPGHWEAKGGKIKVQAPQRSDIKIIPAKAYFTHSHYPLIRGLFKGWMPSFKKMVSEMAQTGDILYTAIEPNLLTTYFNARLAKKLGLKHAFFTWQNVSYRRRLKGLKLRITEYIVRKTVKNSAGAICGNGKAAEILKTYAGPDFKILIAPISGVATEKFRPGIASDFRRENNIENKIVLTFAGVFDNRKGIKTLLEAFVAALKEVSNLHLVMIGTGPLEGFIKGFIGQNKLGNNTTLISWLPNEQLPGVFAGSDIFVHPSEPFGGWEEQFGYSMAEASACALPVIATKTGSIEEIVISGKTGILVEPHQPVQLKEAITKLARDAEPRKQMGRAGREHIEENFSHPIVAKKFYNFFFSL